MSEKMVDAADHADTHCLSITQLSSCTQVRETIIIELVECEVLKPTVNTSSDLLFHPEDLSRLSRAERLMREFELTPVGLALVFDLLDELRALR